MVKEDITYLLKVALFIALFVITIKFIAFLLPFIIIFLVIMFFYGAYKKGKRRKNKVSKKENFIKEAEIINEVKD